ncbi:hypothetical protein ACJX0J_006712, partial [Zea mays]
GMLDFKLICFALTDCILSIADAITDSAFRVASNAKKYQYIQTLLPNGDALNLTLDITKTFDSHMARTTRLHRISICAGHFGALSVGVIVDYIHFYPIYVTHPIYKKTGNNKLKSNFENLIGEFK